VLSERFRTPQGVDVGERGDGRSFLSLPSVITRGKRGIISTTAAMRRRVQQGRRGKFSGSPAFGRVMRLEKPLGRGKLYFFITASATRRVLPPLLWKLFFPRDRGKPVTQGPGWPKHAPLLRDSRTCFSRVCKARLWLPAPVQRILSLNFRRRFRRSPPDSAKLKSAWG